MTNATWLARESLRRLKQMGALQEYVKEFISLILDIKICPRKTNCLTLCLGYRVRHIPNEGGRE